MTLVQINSKRLVDKDQFSLFNLGFRPFFLGAGVFSALSILAWMFIYGFQVSILTGPISLFEWHAHQMIYGFSMAVIAGFLLTAIVNWTNVATFHGTPLKVLFIFWVIPRVLLIFGLHFVEIAAFFDLLFIIGLLYGVTAPIVAVRQWRQVGIIAKVLLLSAGNICYYLDALNIYSNGAFVGIYGGLFLIISLILTIGGRVMPAFVVHGIDHSVKVTNPYWVALLTLILFLTFTINFLFVYNIFVTGITATLLFALTTYRLFCWYAPAIWSQPLLWGLFASYVFIDIGFLLYALYAFGSVSPFIAAHAFAYGGIGLATLCMMIRVSIGHSGRDVRTPPSETRLLISFLVVGAVIRVLGPLVATENYRLMIIASQTLWAFAFAGFTLLVASMLISPRADGQEDIPASIRRMRDKPILFKGSSSF